MATCKVLSHAREAEKIIKNQSRIEYWLLKTSNGQFYSKIVDQKLLFLTVKKYEEHLSFERLKD